MGTLEVAEEPQALPCPWTVITRHSARRRDRSAAADDVADVDRVGAAEYGDLVPEHEQFDVLGG
jgi:hypothetical protein